MENGIYGCVNIEPRQLFSALANEIRLRCLVLLMHHDELCVCEMTHAIGVAQPHISRHLARLRELDMVADRREGLWIHYQINPSIPEWVRGVLRRKQWWPHPPGGRESPKRAWLARYVRQCNGMV